MIVSATLKNRYQENEVSVQTGEDSKTIMIAPKPSGYGSSVNGAELLLASLATCFCNDIYREAAKRNITVTHVQVEVTAHFGAEGEAGSNFQYKAMIESNATARENDDLLTFTDSVAEIHNTLRRGVDVTLARR